MLARGATPDDYLWRVNDMLEALNARQRFELVARAIERVVESYSGAPEEPADIPPGATTASRILADLNRLTRMEGGMGPGLDSMFRFKHHTDMRSDRSRFWGLDRNVPIGLGRLYLALGGWVEYGLNPGLAGLLISSLTALLEDEGFEPRQLGLVALPYTEDRPWAIRLDELLEAVIDPESTASLETGFPVTWENVDQLLEFLVPERRGSKAGRRLLMMAAQTAAQMALDDPDPAVPPVYLEAASRLLENYVEPIIQGSPFSQALRDYGQDIADARPDPGYEPALQAGSRLVTGLNALPRRRKIVDSAENVVMAAAQVWRGSAQAFVPLWWNAVRNRMPIRDRSVGLSRR